MYQQIINVTWYGATEFALYYNYRLPTEAEWEYAAKGIDGRKYPWGNTEPDGTKANYYNGNDGYEDTTSPVGNYEAGKSWCGAYDMAGNVWEWCSDWWGNSYYISSPSTNPIGATSGTFRVLRGGSWTEDTDLIRCATRWFNNPKGYSDYIGFRVVR